MIAPNQESEANVEPLDERFALLEELFEETVDVADQMDVVQFEAPKGNFFKIRVIYKKQVLILLFYSSTPWVPKLLHRFFCHLCCLYPVVLLA